MKINSIPPDAKESLMKKYIVLIVWVFMACSKPAGKTTEETILAPVDMDKCVDENGEALGFPVNQFLVFTNEPHPRADRMRQLAAEWGVELVGQIPDMGIWQLQCDCQTPAELEAFMESAEQRIEVEFAAHNFLLDLQGSVQKSSDGGLCRAEGDLDKLKDAFRLALDSINYYSTVILFDKIKQFISLSPVNILVMDGQFCLGYLQSQFDDIANGLQVVGVNGEAAKQQDAQFCGQPGYGHGAKVLGILAADDDDGGVSGLLKRTLSTDFIVDVAPALTKSQGNTGPFRSDLLQFFYSLNDKFLKQASVVNISMAISLKSAQHYLDVTECPVDIYPLPDSESYKECARKAKKDSILIKTKIKGIFERHSDVLFVLAAGNDGQPLDVIINYQKYNDLLFPYGIPSSQNNVIHVGAYAVPQDENGLFKIWSGSNYITGTTSGIVMVYAPAAPPVLNAQSPDGLPVTTSEAGTSFAAPIVTAQVAMIRAVAPDLTPKEIIEDIIVPTAGLPVSLPEGDLGRGIILFDAVAKALLLREPSLSDISAIVDRNRDEVTDDPRLILHRICGWSLLDVNGFDMYAFSSSLDTEGEGIIHWTYGFVRPDDWNFQLIAQDMSISFGGSCIPEVAGSLNCSMQIGTPFPVFNSEDGTGPSMLFDATKDGIHYTGVALETSAMTFPSCLITQRDPSGNPLSVEMEVLVSGMLEMVRPPENPGDPTPEPTNHEFDGYILTSFMLGESENGIPMQQLYNTLETYCFHGLQ
ncbi:MAG: hypothetical protein CVU65_00805 [Deltaproteobacteria bacterium HGW-Deltaproteobacteria-22]|nr:MAG: hypothetical protein CVU65_00805 [Deltaproteobacteria bacterium HGW-Deltaproteobacteria-22]